MSDCIIWPGALNSGGYPITWYNGKTAYVHRVLIGAKPGEVVLHSCDNPSCINLDHLLIGTHAQNSADMVLKGRQAKGETQGLAKLTWEQVREIRQFKDKLSSRKTAKLFGISKTNVLDIWNKKIWKE